MNTLSQKLRGEDAPGFALFPSFADEETSRAMLDDVVSLCRAAADGTPAEGPLVMPEAQADMAGELPEERISKVFKLHRRAPFQAFLGDPRVAELLAEAIGPDVDCFLSQFIFKNPGARGQPWHQDSYYFPFSPARPVVALWLAITEATLENGCLHILPGSQNEPIHEHIPDQRPNANVGYVEIVDHNMEKSEPCLLKPGDLMLFDSHLMHRSTDNASSGMRAAMVFHFATAGTHDRSRETSPVNDWIAYLRDGRVVL